MDLHHLGAYIVLAYPSCEVLLILVDCRLRYLGGKQALFDLPIEKLHAGIAEPQSAIAIESCCLRGQVGNELDKFFWSRERTVSKRIHRDGLHAPPAGEWCCKREE